MSKKQTFQKLVGNVGSSVGIIFSKNECKIYGIKLDDIIDLSDMVIIKKKKKNDS